jgi:SAM-dependent methyltransferase
LPEPSSTTHVHIAAILNTETGHLSTPTRILDAGCGTGVMLAYLASVLPVVAPQSRWEFYGFDVLDERVQTDSGFLKEARGRLSTVDPEVNWDDRIRGISASDPWPWPDDFFGAVISNQVIEHVVDFAGFVGNTQRVLADGGVSAHIFPLRAIIPEGHILVPLAHKVRDHDVMHRYIRLANQMGKGRCDSYDHPGDCLDRFAE